MDKMREAFERDHGNLAENPDLKTLFECREPLMRWAWQAAQSAAVPDGWQLVPVQPTANMVDSALRRINGYDLQFYGAHELRKEIEEDWKIMITAAPLGKND